MAASITHGVRKFKSDLATIVSPETIQSICRECRHQWRCRVLDPVTTIHAFILQILHGNVAIPGVRHLINEWFTESAYCQARMRLPLEVLQTLAHVVAASVRDRTDESIERWQGHRVFMIDGTSFSMPDEAALREVFRYPGNQKPGCGFPTAHLLTLFDLAGGILLDACASPWRTGDMTHVRLFHDWLRPGDLVLGDRAFCSFPHLCLLLEQGVHAVFRVHQAMTVDFTPGRRHCNPRNLKQVRGIPGVPRSRWIERLGPGDQIVEWLRPRECPPWMTREEFNSLPGAIRVRELRYAIRRRGFRTRNITLVTTLLDAEKCPKETIAHLYRRRWEVETNIRHLKQTLGLDVLKCRTIAGVLKEVMIFGIVYNAVRAIMIEAGERQGVTPDRISFSDVLHWLRSVSLCPAPPPPRFIVNPRRDRPPEPRAVKRRPKPFPLLMRPRQTLRNLLLLNQLGLN